MFSEGEGVMFSFLFSFVFQIKRPSDRVLPPVSINNADLCFDFKSLKPPLQPLLLCEVKMLSLNDLNLIENNLGIFIAEVLQKLYPYKIHSVF